MDRTGILLAGLDSAASQTAAEAAHLAFPACVVESVASAREALGRIPAAGGTEILVLANPVPAEIGRMLDAMDMAGLPRWAVVAFGVKSAPAGAEALASGEWTVPMVRHALGSALAQHSLRREIARARGDLLSIGSRVAHDLRSQAAGILTNAELLAEILSDDNPPRSELARPIFESVDGLGEIIERLAFLAKASARGPVKRRMDMGDAVARALERMDGELRSKGASVVQPPEWPEVACEAAWIEKVWCVLVANALRHGPEHPRIELGWKQGEREHRFWIRDNGAGVPADAQPQLFHPFHLMHRPNSPRGMGLPIVQRLMEMQGGRCGYEAGVQGGSVFFFTLPMEAEVPAAVGTG